MDQCSQIVLGSDSSSVNQTNSRHCRSYQGCYRFSPEHNVYFFQYDAPVSFMTLYTIQPEEGVDTEAYLGKGMIQRRILEEITDLEFKNYKNVKQMYFLHTRTSWDKYMFNGIPKLKF